MKICLQKKEYENETMRKETTNSRPPCLVQAEQYTCPTAVRSLLGLIPAMGSQTTMPGVMRPSLGGPKGSGGGLVPRWKLSVSCRKNIIQKNQDL